jgi:hypothetical protein
MQSLAPQQPAMSQPVSRASALGSAYAPARTAAILSPDWESVVERASLVRSRIARDFPELHECPCLRPARRQAFVEHMTVAAVAAQGPGTAHWYDIGSGGLLTLATQAQALAQAGIPAVRFYAIELEPIEAPQAEAFTRFLGGLVAGHSVTYTWTAPPYAAFVQDLAACRLPGPPSAITMVDGGPARSTPWRARGPQTGLAIFSQHLRTKLFEPFSLPLEGLPLLADIAAARVPCDTPESLQAQDEAETLLMAAYDMTRHACSSTGASSQAAFMAQTDALFDDETFRLAWRDDPDAHLQRMQAIYPDAIAGAVRDEMWVRRRGAELPSGLPPDRAAHRA